MGQPLALPRISAYIPQHD